MTESTITAKGQTTVPLEVRKIIGTAPGMRLVWHAIPDGAPIVRAKNNSILDLAGGLQAPKGQRAGLADMYDLR